jgi:hypothetical protein
MGLYKGTVQNIVTGSYMLPSADDKRKINVSKEKVRGKTKREEVIYFKKHNIPCFGLGGLSHTKKKRRITRRARYVDKYHKTEYMAWVRL